MKRIKNYLIGSLLILVLGLYSCTKKEKLYPIPTYPQGMQSEVFAMGLNYENQLYFQFNKQKTFSQLSKISQWDLGFSCNGEAKIIVNGAKNADFGVFPLGPGIGFDAVKKPDPNWIYKFDLPSGFWDSTVFKNWCNYNDRNKSFVQGNEYVYVIKTGNKINNVLEYIKVKIKYFESNAYHIVWQRIGDESQHSEIIEIDRTKNFKYIAFKDSNLEFINVEPLPKTDWDVFFTQYKDTAILGGIKLPYIVTGILINPFNTEIKEINLTQNPWEKINLDFAVNLKLNKNLCEIGFDWKEYVQAADLYVMDATKAWILKDQYGNYFKLRILSFHFDQFKKGYPRLAWELLK